MHSGLIVLPELHFVKTGKAIYRNNQTWEILGKCPRISKERKKPSGKCQFQNSTLPPKYTSF
jgi:hypothetical protein